jgi:hypothetical protein
MFRNRHSKPERSRLEAADADLRTLRELCHDLTVPATSIKLPTQVAAAESDPGPAMRARLRQISGEATRIEHRGPDRRRPAAGRALHRGREQK